MIFSALNIVWIIAQLFVALFFYTALRKLIELEKIFKTLNGSLLLKPFASFRTYGSTHSIIIYLPLTVFNIPIGKRKVPTQKIGLIAGGILLYTIHHLHRGNDFI